MNNVLNKIKPSLAGMLVIFLCIFVLAGCRHASVIEPSGSPSSPSPSVQESSMESTEMSSAESSAVSEEAGSEASSESGSPDQVISFYSPEPQYPLFDLNGDADLWLDLNLIDSGLTADHAVQGIAMGSIDGKPLLFLTMTDGQATDSGILILYDLEEMTIITSTTGCEIGHGNGVTFCSKDHLFYVACGGGHNGLKKIRAYNTSLECVRDISLEGVDVGAPYGITYDSERELFLAATGGQKLTEFDYDFNILRKADTLLPDDTYVVQSIFWDGASVNHIFVAKGKVNSLLYKYRWTEDEIAFDSAEWIDYQGELEAGVVYGRQRYLAFRLLGGVLLQVTDIP